MFKSELDVRRWFAKNAPGEKFWIEAASGGTFGLPDLFIVHDGGRIVWYELKIGQIAVRKKRAVLDFHVRPAQKSVINRLVLAGAHVEIAIGLKSSNSLILAKPDGRWAMDKLTINSPEVPYREISRWQDT